MQMLSRSIPFVSQEFYDAILQAFPVLIPEPDKTTIDQIMYNAGQQYMLQWIQKQVRNNSTREFNNREAV